MAVTVSEGETGGVLPAVEMSGPRSWRRAFADIAQGWRQRSLWGYLGWQDIKQRYRRSVLGPLWISISMGVIALGLGILYSALLDVPLAKFLPHVAVGLLIWNFVSGCILEGSEVFISNEGLIKFLPAPLTLHIYRLIWRQSLFFLHNLVVWAVLMVVYPRALGWEVLLAFPAFALLALNGAWVAILSGILATRFRDIPPILTSVTQLVFYLTPIVWSVDILARNPAAQERAHLVELNPVFHFLEILRQPLIGEPIVGRYWMVAGVITVVGWAAALVCLRNYRSRVAYWV